MKLVHLFLLFLGTTLFIACGGKAQNKDKESKQSLTVQNRIEVLDFHTAHRCTSCLAIEEFAKETLNTYFTKELEQGKIVFRLVNADLPENEALVNKFQAYGTALYVFTVYKDKETIVDLTDFAFLNVDNKQNFIRQFKDKITAELTKIP